MQVKWGENDARKKSQREKDSILNSDMYTRTPSWLCPHVKSFTFENNNRMCMCAVAKKHSAKKEHTAKHKQ